MKPGWKNDVHWRRYYDERKKEEHVGRLMRKHFDRQIEAVDHEALRIIERAAEEAMKNNEPRH